MLLHRVAYVRLAALIGLAQSLAIGLSVAYAPHEWPWAYFLMFGAHLVLVFGVAGRVLGTDGSKGRDHVGSHPRPRLGRRSGRHRRDLAGSFLRRPVRGSRPDLRFQCPSVSLVPTTSSGPWSRSPSASCWWWASGPPSRGHCRPRPHSACSPACHSTPSWASPTRCLRQPGRRPRSSSPSPWSPSSWAAHRRAPARAGRHGRLLHLHRERSPMTRIPIRQSSVAHLATSRRGLSMGASGLVLLAAGQSYEPSSRGAAGGTASGAGPLPISAIPNVTQALNRLYGDVAARFADATGLDVTYTSVTEYPAVVRGFEVGDIAIADGGLTGVQWPCAAARGGRGIRPARQHPTRSSPASSSPPTSRPAASRGRRRAQRARRPLLHLRLRDPRRPGDLCRSTSWIRRGSDYSRASRASPAPT